MAWDERVYGRPYEEVKPYVEAQRDADATWQLLERWERHAQGLHRMLQETEREIAEACKMLRRALEEVEEAHRVVFGDDTA